MNFKTTLILLVLLAVVGAFVAYDRFSGRDKETVETTSNVNRLFDVKDKDAVNSVSIKSQDDGEIVLTKVGETGKWRMTKPVDAAAEGWQVDSLVRDLIALESKAVVDPAGKGFDKPKFHIEIAAKGGKLLKFDVGDKTAMGDLYVKVEGKKEADVVSADVYDRLAKPAGELRDKQLVTVSGADIKQLTIDSEGQKLVLQKKGTAWELVEPKRLPVDEVVAADLVGAVTGLRASDWVAKDSPDVAKAQFDKPLLTVAFTTAAPATQPTAVATTTTAPASQPAWTTITFGQYEDIRHQKVYARLSDTNAVVKTMATPIDTLTKKPIELRDKKVADLQPEQVSKISILADLPAGPAPTTKPGKKSQVEIERRKQVADATTKPSATTKPTTQAATTQPAAAATQAAKAPASTWELKSDPKGDADDEAVRNLLAELHPLRATKYHDATPATKPTGNYVLRVTTEAAGGAGSMVHEIKLIDPGHDQPVLAEYNGLSFELPRTFLTKLEGNFAKKPKAAAEAGGGAAPVDPAGFKLPGEK
jgi:hypothetical protein